MKKYISIIKAVLIVSVIIPLYQNCGRLKSSGTNGAFNSTTARNSEFDYVVFNAAYEEITDANPIFNVGEKYNFRINKEKLEGTLIFWDLVFLGASCDLKVFGDKESAEMECFSNGEIGVSVTAVYPNGSEKYGEIRGFVYDAAGSGGGSNIVPITVTIRAAGNTQDWFIENAPSDHNQVNIVTGSGTNRSAILYKGQPLRIVNTDDEEHRPGGVTDGIPCKTAPFNLKTDQSYECVTNTALADPDKYIIDRRDSMTLMDGGRFTFSVVDSKAVWDSYNCTSCHGMKSADSPNAMLTMLNTAIADVPAMTNLYSTMTNEDKRALSFYMIYQPQ